jgi:hypothetical protein
MFEHCYFITGSNKAIIIVLPCSLPQAEVFTISVSPGNLSFFVDYEPVADVPYDDTDIFDRLSHHHQIGLIEFEEQKSDSVPDYITNVAYVQVWGEA